MNPWIIGYFLLGIFIYLTLWLWAGSNGKENSSDVFFMGATDLIFLAIWPLALPFMIRDTLREAAGVNHSSVARKPDPMIGAKGIVTTDLRPGGEVDIAGERLQAVAAFGVIDRGATIEVLSRDSFRVSVRRIDSDPETNEDAQQDAGGKRE